MAEQTSILCFTDVLCVFCYLADARLEQLKADFGRKVDLTYHFMSVYGDVRRRLVGVFDAALTIVMQAATVHGRRRLRSPPTCPSA